MPDDPLVHLASIHEALLEASAAIEASTLGVEAERASKAVSDALSAPHEDAEPPPAPA